MNLQKIVNKFGRKIKKSSPTILTFVGAGGVIATSVLAVRATTKALRTLDEEQITHKDPFTKVEIAQIAWKFYIPTILVGATTMSCIFGANVLNKRQQASITSIYAMLDQSYKNYVKAAKEVYGEDADQKIRAQVAKDMYVHCDGYSVYNPDDDTSSEWVLFYDYQSNRYFQSTMAAVLNALYHLNRIWAMAGEVSINKFYEFVGIEEIPNWDGIGWGYDFVDQNFTWIDFSITKTQMDDDLECYIISPVYEPEFMWGAD